MGQRVVEWEDVSGITQWIQLCKEASHYHAEAQLASKREYEYEPYFPIISSQQKVCKSEIMHVLMYSTLFEILIFCPILQL